MGASSRLRFEQFGSALDSAGISVTYCPLLRNRYLELLYTHGTRSKGELLRGLLRRALDTTSVHAFDGVWLEGELFPWLPTHVELSILKRARALIVDYDDPIFLRYSSSAAPWAGKIEALMKRANIVVAANPTLVAHAEKAGARRVEFIPTVVDCARYEPGANQRQGQPMVVGWIGTPQTAPYLGRVAPVLSRLLAEGLIEVRIIGADDAALIPGAVSIPWHEESEAADIDEFDIGIMPLDNDVWSKGKSGFKLIQYMAARKPVVASPVGFNVNLVEDSGAGFLANSPDEWEAALRTLIGNRALRHWLGMRGRRHVERNFSVNAVAPRLVRLFRELQQNAA